MAEQESSVSFQEYVSIKRNQIIIAYDNSKEIALRNFDDIVKKLGEQMRINEGLKVALEHKEEPEKKKKQIDLYIGKNHLT